MTTKPTCVLDSNGLCVRFKCLVHLTFYSAFSVSFALSQILDMLDLGDGPDKACSIAVIPQDGKDAVLSECDSDGSDVDYEEDTGLLPARLLDGCAELMQENDQ